MIFLLAFAVAKCDVDVFDAEHVDLRDLELNFKRPVKIVNLLKWDAFHKWDTPPKFADLYGHHEINANRTSYAQGLDHTSVNTYMEHAHREHIIVMDDARITDKENEFLNSIFRDFNVPRLFENITYARVLSLGGGLRGVDMMKHCVAWIGMVAGRKRWYLADPNHRDVRADCVDPIEDDRVLECVVEKGDVMYVPDFWWHATCNLDPYTVAIGTQCPSFHYHKYHDRWLAMKDEL